MNNNKQVKILLEGLVKDSVAFLDLKDFMINSNKVAKVELHLVIFLKNLKSFLVGKEAKEEAASKCQHKREKTLF